MKPSRLQRHKPLVGNLDTHRAWQDRSREKQAGKPRRQRDTGPSRKTRDSLAERSGGICEYPACGQRADHDHHRQGRKAGGTRRARINALPNQVHLCWRHHEQVGLNPAWAETQGLIVREPTDPATVPVLLRHGLVLLDDHGGYEPADTNTQPRGASAA